MATLFNIGSFVLHAGSSSSWKVDCDALTAEDILALARMASEVLKPFDRVVGIPRGGIPFAEALESYMTPGADRVLIADDVYTTGTSMNKMSDQVMKEGASRVIGIVIFARNKPMSWITAIWQRG